jgi:hypothetical protein
LDWGEEKPNGEFRVNFRQEDRMNGILDFGWWIFDGIQHSAFKI